MALIRSPRRGCARAHDAERTTPRPRPPSPRTPAGAYFRGRWRAPSGDGCGWGRRGIDGGGAGGQERGTGDRAARSTSGAGWGVGRRVTGLWGRTAGPPRFDHGAVLDFLWGATPTITRRLGAGGPPPRTPGGCPAAAGGPGVAGENPARPGSEAAETPGRAGGPKNRQPLAPLWAGGRGDPVAVGCVDDSRVTASSSEQPDQPVHALDRRATERRNTTTGAPPKRGTSPRRLTRNGGHSAGGLPRSGSGRIRTLAAQVSILVPAKPRWLLAIPDAIS